MERQTQAQWDNDRAKVKAKAAKVVKANAEAAQAAKRAFYGQTPVTPSVTVEETETEETKPYDEWTNDELSAELTVRDLPHTGNKAELVARLEESDTEEAE